MSQQGGQRGGNRGRGAPRGRGGGPDSGAGRGRGDSGGSGFRGGPRGGGGGGGRGGGRGGGGPGGFYGRGGPPQIFAAGVPPRPDDRLSSLGNAVQANLKNQGKYNPRHPLRPGFGTLGQEVILRANFFPVTVPKGPIYEYTVEIEPKVINKLKPRMFQLLEQSPTFKSHVPYIAHDRGARMVAARELPQPLNVQIVFFEDGMSPTAADNKTYSVTITANGQIETSGLQR
jgi:eukaryotic translation initiation factor 2C